MSKGTEKHLFPGGNTSSGFFSYYNEIMSPGEANRFIIIKGGPGTGKSTFMKKIGDNMLQRGYDVEFLHCSSDNSSLDGVKIPSLGTAIIDGTAPHTVDPKNPGAVDEILNFGEFWDDKGIRTHKQDIIKTTSEISGIFSRAYKYLRAAYSIFQDSAEIYRRALDKGMLNQYSIKLREEIFSGLEPSAGLGKAYKEGTQRSMFASAITPAGLCNYLDNILKSGRIYEIKGEMGTGEEIILEKTKSAALEKGLYVEAFYCALNPHKLEHIIIPALDVGITTSNRHHASTVKKHSSIDMISFYNTSDLDGFKEDLTQNQTQFQNLLTIAQDTIKSAKALHDKLETYYIPNISFKLLDECCEKTIKKILETN